MLLLVGYVGEPMGYFCRVFPLVELCLFFIGSPTYDLSILKLKGGNNSSLLKHRSLHTNNPFPT